MRFMIIVKATADSEAGVMPEERLFEQMADYHEELARAGVLVDADGLHPSSKGWRISYSGDKRTVTDGPFPETKELIAGYTLIDVASRDDALEWARRFPDPAQRGGGVIEVRQVYDLDDFQPSPAIERFRALEARKGRVLANRVTPFLWFEGKAQEAAEFYTSLIPNSRVTDVSQFDPEGLNPSGAPCASVTFELDGRQFVAFDGGGCADMKFSPATSLMVTCRTQEEIDTLWEKLGDGGEYMACGWVTDRFGLTWQVVPATLDDMLLDRDRARATAVMQAMLEMGKLDIAALQRAYDGAAASSRG